MTKPASRWWTYGWVAWIVGFLALEIPAAITEGAGTRTLSKFIWRWFPTWSWWGVIASFGAYLFVGHFSPDHLSWIPVATLGAVIGGRIGWCVVRDWGTT